MEVDGLGRTRGGSLRREGGGWPLPPPCDGGTVAEGQVKREVSE